MFIYLRVVYGWFHTTVAEASSCNSSQMAHKPKIFTIWLCKKTFADLSPRSVELL